jgi:hypothetical protein
VATLHLFSPELSSCMGLYIASDLIVCVKRRADRCDGQALEGVGEGVPWRGVVSSPLQ